MQQDWRMALHTIWALLQSGTASISWPPLVASPPLRNTHKLSPGQSGPGLQCMVGHRVVQYITGSHSVAMYRSIVALC